LRNEQQAWAKKIYDTIIAKETAVVKRSGMKIPYTTQDGVFDDKYATDPAWWTNCFWHGILWQLYAETKDESIKELAGKLEERMDPVLNNAEGVHHDVGFMWLHASVANWRATGNAPSRNRGLIAAAYLASRYNPGAGFITAWNGKDREGWSIVDTMMNLPLLYWAETETGYGRYGEIARAHADKTLENVIRPDGSVVHIIEYSLTDGSVLDTYGGQGYAVGS
jgi:unsaturated chondroitin disaccharide hydrolase